MRRAIMQFSSTTDQRHPLGIDLHPAYPIASQLYKVDEGTWPYGKRTSGMEAITRTASDESIADRSVRRGYARGTEWEVAGRPGALILVT